MRKYMSQLVRGYLNEETYGQSATARFGGPLFFSYNTIICVRKDNYYYLTLEKFSKTTTTQQKALQESIPAYWLKIVSYEELQEIARTI